MMSLKRKESFIVRTFVISSSVTKTMSAPCVDALELNLLNLHWFLDDNIILNTAQRSRKVELFLCDSQQACP